MIGSAEPAARPAARPAGDDADREVGTMVHRLLQRFGFDAAGSVVDARTALAMLRAEELAAHSSARLLSDLATDAVTAYRAICGRTDLRNLYPSGRAMHEVPFTMEIDGRIVHGTIDCVIRGSRGELTVLEFKTGRAQDIHQAQLEIYRQAIERLFPDAEVAASLVYASGAPA